MNSWIDIKYKFDQYENIGRSFFKDIRQLVNLNKTGYKKYEERIFLNWLYFEVTNICNAKCVFCAYPSAKHKRGLMKFVTFKKAIDEYSRLGGKNVSFTPTVGDPLIDPDLLEKINYAVELDGIENVCFYTNGILLGKNKMYKKLVDSGIDEIHISIPETNKKMYERICKVKIYDEMIRGIHELLSYNKLQNYKIKIYFKFRPASNPSDVLKSPDFIRYIKPFVGDKVRFEFMVDYDNWGGAIGKRDLFGVMRLRRVQRLKILPCIRTFDASVLFDGSVRLCACRIKTTEFDDLVVGNINDDSLKNIFYSKRTKEVRNRFIKNDLPEACKDCSFYMPIKKKFFKNRLV